MEALCKNRYKQRHTAQRIHNRLVAECPEYDASYPLVQRYVRSLREARHQEGTLELEWPPGEAQVDFGETDVYDADGEKKACKFLCVTFPYSNAGYKQLFRGETAECVVHGLRDIFHRIGGVPGRLVFDFDINGNISFHPTFAGKEFKKFFENANVTVYRS